ncbi:hypothetical protein [Solirubrobacter soli]|uniref:hypothetical protein n=1 Tax=Solirubrobacter soli TaxID=363832 RepID=UPI00069FC597|nr:hypothetical protein [Solirubrobacter soli]
MLRGFPEAVRDDALIAVRALPPREYPASVRDETVAVGEERIAIPYRVHYPELAVPEELSDRQRRIANCIYSRHGDGYVRERSIARVLDATEPWVIPYVLQLLGEYVVEICLMILARAPLTSLDYRAFAQANRDFIDLTEQRATSYWGAYYRCQYAQRCDFPALVALDLVRTRGHATLVRRVEP